MHQEYDIRYPCTLQTKRNYFQQQTYRPWPMSTSPTFSGTLWRTSSEGTRYTTPRDDPRSSSFETPRPRHWHHILHNYYKYHRLANIKHYFHREGPPLGHLPRRHLHHLRDHIGGAGATELRTSHQEKTLAHWLWQYKKIETNCLCTIYDNI